MSSMASQITIGYWSIRGLAAPLRMMLMYSGIPFQSTSFDVVAKEGGGWDISDWSNQKPALKAKNPLMNLPYLIDGDVVVAQSNACFLYLGRKLKMLGTNELELTECKCTPIHHIHPSLAHSPIHPHTPLTILMTITPP